jgi:hypothetical protein
MSRETGREEESNGHSRRPRVLDGGPIWASPPTGSRVSDRRVPSAAPASAYVWLTAPVIDQTAGNVLHTAGATVTNRAHVIDEVPTHEPAARLPAISDSEPQLDELPVADESLAEAATAEADHEATDVAVTEASVAEQIAEPAVTDTTPEEEPEQEPEREVTDLAVADAEPWYDTDLSTDEQHTVAVAEPALPETRSEQDTDDEVTQAAAPRGRLRRPRRVPRPRTRVQARRTEPRSVAEASIDVDLATDEQHTVEIAEPDIREVTDLAVAEPWYDTDVSTDEQHVVAVAEPELPATASEQDTDDEVTEAAGPRGRLRRPRRAPRARGQLRARWAELRSVAEASIDVDLATDEQHTVEIAEPDIPEVADAAVAEPSVDVDIATDEPHGVAVAVAEPELSGTTCEQDTADEVTEAAAPRHRVRRPRRAPRPRGRLRARWAERRTVAEASIDIDLTIDEQHVVEIAEPEVPETGAEQDNADEVTEAAIADASICTPVGSDEVQELQADLDIVPEPAVVDVTDETPADDVRDHAATCRCLACGSTVFEPVPVTEGPLAGKAFYYRAARQAVSDPTRSTGTETESPAQ